MIVTKKAGNYIPFVCVYVCVCGGGGGGMKGKRSSELVLCSNTLLLYYVSGTLHLYTCSIVLRTMFNFNNDIFCRASTVSMSGSPISAKPTPAAKPKSAHIVARL